MGKKATEQQNESLIASNKKARRDYEILQTLEAGIALVGSEVKSLREGGVNLKDSYVRIIRGECFLVGCHISPYSHSRVDAHETTRDRKLLLHRREIERLVGSVQQKGLSLIPLKLYFKQGRAKLEIGLGKGKKLHDKRQDLKSREAQREIQRALRGRRS